MQRRRIQELMSELEAEAQRELEMQRIGAAALQELEDNIVAQSEPNLPDINSELDTHSAVSYHWRVWQLMGLIRPPGASRLGFVLRSLIINVLVTLLFPITLLAKLFYTYSLRELCENLTITITDIVANLKFINVFHVRRQLHEIKQLLAVLDGRALAVNNADELAVLRQAVHTARLSFRTFGGIFVFGTTLSCLRVAIAKERQLLYPAWFGIDWQYSNVAYVLIYVYQLFGLIVQAIQDCANDSYPPAYLCILTGHMRALELRVRRIGYHVPHQHVAYFELTACIEDYVNILRLHAIIQQILSVACFAQFMCSAAVQCTVAMHFLYVADSHDLSAMILSLVFFSAVTLEVFIICYFGDRMRTQSEALLNAFYACNWMDQNTRFKRNLIITLMRTQRPSYILAGGYIAVTLETFVQVNRLTYSVFTLLLRAK
ncbi:odorant receptor 2a [Drosophila sulfurigaster albostrigata]|uniref:odorant receptor 2a n=1 Tax=Drosophila sulfurigaster albostrigata TaxID=89887 RepID=UPI002D21A351|nr:odorant receptor 2a [Drosophila sulfurigaster albostrigata]